MLRSTQHLSLDKITEFKPELISCFAPESSICVPSTDALNTSRHVFGQFRDMFHTYEYAQDEILPAIRRIGLAHITSTQVLEWINCIHRRVAASMAADGKSADLLTVAGEYTKVQVVRWRFGLQVARLLRLYLIDQLPRDIDLLQETEKLGMDRSLVKRLIQLLIKIRDDETIQLPEDPRGSSFRSNLPEHDGSDVIEKLCVQYHANRLTKAEKEATDHALIICLPPERMTQAMHEFADRLVADWQRCDANDLDQICRLAYIAFKGIAGIHPYFNCNGRTATCWMNIMLRTLNTPTILLRLPGERDDSSSAYSQAIDHIDTRPELFIAHIKQRIQAEKNTPYTDSLAAELVTKRMEVSEHIAAIQLQFSQYPLASYFHELVKKTEEQTKLEVDPEEVKANNNIFYTPWASKMAASLAALRQTLLRQTQSVVQRTYTDAEKAAIVAKLTALTGLDSDKWQCFKEVGLTLLYRFDSDGKDASDPESKLRNAEKIAADLNNTGALMAKALFNYRTAVLRLENIHPEKLESFKLENTEQHQASSCAAAAASM